MWVTFLCVMFWGGSFMRYVWTSGEGEEIPQKPRCQNWRLRGEVQFRLPQHTPSCARRIERPPASENLIRIGWGRGHGWAPPPRGLHSLKPSRARRPGQRWSLYLQTLFLIRPTLGVSVWKYTHLFLLSQYQEWNQIGWFKFLLIIKKTMLTTTSWTLTLCQTFHLYFSRRSQGTIRIVASCPWVCILFLCPQKSWILAGHLASRLKPRLAVCGTDWCDHVTTC